jgi:hypothetical protein
MKLTNDEIRVVVALLLALLLGTGVRLHRDRERAAAPPVQVEIAAQPGKRGNDAAAREN